MENWLPESFLQIVKLRREKGNNSARNKTNANKEQTEGTKFVLRLEGL
jgi:hypothetical protein